MLKLERNTVDNQVSFSLRDEERLFSRPFLIALAIAVFVHLLPLLLFHVAPIKTRWNRTTLAPIIVEAAPFQPSAHIIDAESKQQTLPFENYFNEAPPSPSLPQSPAFTHSGQLASVQPPNVSSNPFNELEKEITLPIFSKKTSSLKPISLIISGPLSLKRLVNNGLNDKSLPITPSMDELPKEFRFDYLVQVEGETGRIFWYEPLQKITHASIRKVTEAIINDLQFESTPPDVITTGRLELHFHFPETTR